MPVKRASHSPSSDFEHETPSQTPPRRPTAFKKLRTAGTCAYSKSKPSAKTANSTITSKMANNCTKQAIRSSKNKKAVRGRPKGASSNKSGNATSS